MKFVLGSNVDVKIEVIIWIGSYFLYKIRDVALVFWK